MKRFSLTIGFLLVSSLVHAAEPANAGGFWQAVRWKTPDGVQLVGLYHPASEHKRTWVLLHGLGSNKGEWDTFARLANAHSGDGFLIYDMRGHGDSIQSANQGVISYKQWTQGGPGSPWDRMAADLEGAVQMLISEHHLKEVQIAVGGASLGANVATVYAGSHKAVPALLLLSPGLVYAGVATQPSFNQYGKRPVFIAASPGDAYAFDSMRQLAMARGDAGVRLVSGRGAAHGVNMLDAEFTPRLISWMKEVEIH